MTELAAFLIGAGVLLLAAVVLPRWWRAREQWREVFYGSGGAQEAKAEQILQQLRERGLRVRIRHMGGWSNVQMMGRRYISVRVHQRDATEAMRVIRDLGLRP